MTNTEDTGKLNINGTIYKTHLSEKFANRKSYEPADPKIILSFIPGTVLDINIKAGDKVKKGDVLMILEAMKMKNRLKAPADGVIKSVCASAGTRVKKGEPLVEME
jgi:biotin carboxyl carrier protein